MWLEVQTFECHCVLSKVDIKQNIKTISGAVKIFADSLCVKDSVLHMGGVTVTHTGNACIPVHFLKSCELKLIHSSVVSHSNENDMKSKIIL